MHKVVLVPGYATELEVQHLRRPRGIDAGFSAFHRHMRQGNTVAFRWGIARTLSPIAALLGVPTLALYREEEVRAVAPATLSAFATFLTQEQPNVIVAHSLGARLVTAYCRNHTLPASVTRIVLCQADMAPEDLYTHDRVDVVNVYCPWDPSLAISAILHGGARAGLHKLPNVHNVHIPLWRPLNLHTSSIRDPRLVTIATAPHATP